MSYVIQMSFKLLAFNSEIAKFNKMQAKKYLPAKRFVEVFNLGRSRDARKRH